MALMPMIALMALITLIFYAQFFELISGHETYYFQLTTYYLPLPSPVIKIHQQLLRSWVALAG